ncbi:hypothetical protein GCM10027610_024760 [Dactylosporangium cerinum]
MEAHHHRGSGDCFGRRGRTGRVRRHTGPPPGSHRVAGRVGGRPAPPLSDGGSGPGWFLDGFANQSVRQVVRVSTGGSRVRIRLSNRFGVEPLHVAGATIAKAGSGAKLKPGTLRALTFGRRLSATIAPGRELTSDAAGLPVSALDSLSVTLYFTKPTGPATFHDLGLTTAYRASGDHRFDPSGTAFAGDTSNSRYYLAGIDVDGQRTARGTVVAFGDSITDGYGTATNTDNRYPDELAERLVSAGKRFGVVNEGVNGNKLLGDSTCYGERGSRASTATLSPSPAYARRSCCSAPTTSAVAAIRTSAAAPPRWSPTGSSSTASGH